ncbi:hypothetical protein HNP32_001328 [Brevundimonas bullata]|uniref:Uncharacterized protein n=1 Tax=Brevundimonas bullata TaxID=13160 RepID=A0A7W7ING2_9CAUL|nr:hypothetical protein [Brevundimonas bullata]MBB6382564.1 hypothetical protein [Brevundimonas bullata]
MHFTAAKSAWAGGAEEEGQEEFGACGSLQARSPFWFG